MAVRNAPLITRWRAMSFAGLLVRSPRRLIAALVVALMAGACSPPPSPRATLTVPTTTSLQSAWPSTTAGTPRATIPPLLDAENVYAADRQGHLSPATSDALYRVYVPNSEAGTVDVINPTSYKVESHFAVGALPQHVVPSWDLRTLYVTNDQGNTLTPINPSTTRPGPTIAVEDPYYPLWLYATNRGARPLILVA